MFSISKRSDVEPFHAMDVLAEATKRRAGGHPVISMAVGQPSHPAPQAALQAAREALAEGRIGYTDALGTARLKSALAWHYRDRHGLEIDPARIAVTTGSSAGFNLALVAIISWPKLTLFRDGGMETEQAVGALCVLFSAVLGGMAMIQVRRLVEEEKTATIVLYFSLTASVFSLASLPFGWHILPWPSALFLVAAGFCGGVAQILLTESYRHADVSTIAPFEYTSILLGGIVGYFVFGDVPSLTMLTGTVIVVAAGIFIIYREHQLGIEQREARKATTPQA